MKPIVKKAASLILAGAMAATSVVGLSGCSGGDADRKITNVAVIYSAHRGDATNAQLASDGVIACAESGGQFAAITLDGDPACSYTYDASLPEDTENNTNTRIAQNESLMMGMVNNLVADDEEVDVITALEYGAACLPAENEDESNVLVLVFDGVGTKGAYNLTSVDVTNIDVNDYVARVKGAGMLPDLSKVDSVAVYGIGSTAEGASAMDLPTRTAVGELLTAVIEACGVDTVTINDKVADNVEPAADLPYVTPVTFQEANVDFSSIARGSSVTLDQDTLGFVGDRADFIDPAAASQLLGQIADAMQEHPDWTLTITGYTASYPSDPSWPVELSQQRAQRVMDELVSLGVDASRITAVGAGVGPYNDLDAQGQQIADMAQMNRFVTIEII